MLRTSSLLPLSQFRMSRRARVSWVALALGCSVLDSSDYPLSVDIISEGPAGATFPSPTVQVTPGQVTIEVEQGFNDPGYRIHAKALSEESTNPAAPEAIQIEVSTEKLSGDFVAINWAREYRLRISSVPAGTYTLRLHWQNNYLVPSARSKVLVDTVVVVP